MSITSKEIEWFLTHGQSSPFHYRRYVVVANVDWGLLPWEADVVAMSAAGHLSEIEIKISLSDLKRDAAKKKHARWHSDNLVRKFFYAMPESVWAKVASAPPIPEYAGVFVLDNGQLKHMRHAIAKPHARKLTDSERFQLARLGSMRYWSRLPVPESVEMRRKAREEAEKTRWIEWERQIEAQATTK